MEQQAGKPHILRGLCLSYHDGITMKGKKMFNFGYSLDINRDMLIKRNILALYKEYKVIFWKFNTDIKEDYSVEIILHNTYKRIIHDLGFKAISDNIFMNNKIPIDAIIKKIVKYPLLQGDFEQIDTNNFGIQPVPKQEILYRDQIKPYKRDCSQCGSQDVKVFQIILSVQYAIKNKVVYMCCYCHKKLDEESKELDEESKELDEESKELDCNKFISNIINQRYIIPFCNSYTNESQFIRSILNIFYARQKHTRLIMQVSYVNQMRLLLEIR
jgi:hypothetical protein